MTILRTIEARTMMTRSLHRLIWVMAAMVLVAAPLPSGAQTRRPAAMPKAGNIAALLPVAKITRGTGQTKSVIEAKKGDEVSWNDLIQTERGGRARILLNDQSVISLGSQAELRIIQHDSRSQQTRMQLEYGRVRLQVASITRDNGRFELRTPTAVAGVIGTEFGSDSSLPGVTDFICITGIVAVANEDPKVGGSVQCPAGSTTTVNKGMAPSAPRPATQQQIRQLIQDTEPATISSFSPASALLGTEVVSNVTGSKMAGINAVAISGDGVTVALQGVPTDTSAGVKISVAANAAAGPRTISFTKTNGQTTAAVFSILAPPTSGTTVDFAALKKSYLDIIDEERQSSISGINALGVSVQQSSESTEQAIQAENGKLAPPLDAAKIEADLKADSSPMLQAMNTAGTGINEDSAKAGKDLEAGLDALEKRLAAQLPAPTEEAKAKAAKDAFDAINAQLLKKFDAAQGNVAAVAKSIEPKFLATQQRWLEAVKLEAVKQKAVPLPKIDADEKSYDVGLMATFDGSRSTGAAGSAITGYSWVLCDPGYKPQQVGIPLPASDTRCRPISGYGGTSPEFKFQTCMLNPQDYIARLTIVDASNKSASMDVRVRVLPPQYEEPGGRLRSLADAYQQLQPNTFTSYFDESYSGLTELQESIRRTFASLASMNINLRLSQASLGCNEATIRADWDQNYTFKEDQTCVGAPLGSNCQRVVFRQSEQLTARMKRIPGKNWYITDFQGDNGTVQGVPPGPIQRDTALPDFQISSLNAIPAAAREDQTAVGITPGLNSFTALVTNVGTAASSGTVRVRFAINDANGTEVASDVRDITSSIPAGGSASVTGQLSIPDLGPTAEARVFATVNPGCSVTEKYCDGSNATLLDVIVGNVDLAVISAVQVGGLIGTQSGQMDVVVQNVGTRSSGATFGNLRVLSGTTIIGSAGIPSLAPGASITVPVTIIAPNLAGTQPVSVTISPSTPGDLNLSNNTISSSLNITQAIVDLQVTALAFSGGSGPFLSGQTVTVTANVANIGNRPTSTDFFVCRLTGTPGTVNFSQQFLPTIAAGASLTGVTYSFVVPANFAGVDSLACGATQDAFEPVANVTNNQQTLSMTVNINVDLQVVNVPAANTPFQMGSNSAYSFGILNAGGDTVPAGWDVVLNVNGGPVGTFVSTAPLAGGVTLPVSINFLVPSPAPAPADVTGIATSIQVNANAAATETITTNNTANTIVRLVDFTLSVIPTGPFTSVTGRTFSALAVQVNPSTYPLPIVMGYTGLPAGLAATGTNGVSLTGTVSAAPGSFTVGASGTVAGINHPAGSTFGINVVPEISITPGTPPALTAVSGGGPTQPATVNIAGGIYPLGLAVVQPTGIAITGPTTLGAAGLASYNLSADTIAASGAQTFLLTVTDPGNANTPGNVVTFNVPYSVIGFVDLSIQPFVITPGGPYISGQNIAVQLVVNNLGNAATSAANTYSCQHNGTPGVLPIVGGSLPVIAPNSSTTIPVNFVMPPNRSPLSIFECTVSQDPQEGAGVLTDNFRSLNLTVNQNVDLQVTAVSGPSATQMGSTATINITVKNNGLDTAGAGWDVGAKINGSVVGTPGTGSSLAGGASVTFTPSVPVPQIGVAPTNSGAYSLEGFVNANTAVTETSAANNILASTINLVDFRIVQVSSGGSVVVGRSMSLTPAVQIDPSSYPLPLTVNFTGLPAGTNGSGAPYGQNITGTPTTAGSATVTADATVGGVLRTMPANIPLTINNEISLTLAATFNPLASGGAPEALQINVAGGIYPVTITLPPLPTGITTVSPTTVVLAAPGMATWNLQAGLNSTPGSFNLLFTATDGGSAATSTAAGSATLNVPGSVSGQSNYILTSASVAAPHTTGTGADSLQVGETAVFNFTAQNIGNLSQAGTLGVHLVTTCGTGPYTATVTAPNAGASVSGSINLPVSCAPAAYSYTITIATAPAETSTSDNSIGPFNFQVFDFVVTNASGISPQNIRLGSTGTFSLNLAQGGPAAPISLPLSITNGGKASTSPTGTTSSTGGSQTVSVTNSSAVSGDNETIVASITRLGVTKTDSQSIRFYTAQVDNISPGQPGSTSATPLTLGIGQSAQTVDFKLVGTFAGSATFVMPVVTGFNITLVGPAPSLPNDTFTLSIAAVAGAPTTVVSVPILFNIPNTNPGQTVSTNVFVGAFAPPSITVSTPVGTGTRFGSRDFNTYPLLSGEAGDLNIPVNNLGNGPSTAGLGLRVRLGGPSGPVLNAATTVPSVPANTTSVIAVHIVAPEPLTAGTSSFYVEVDQDPRESTGADNNASLPIKTSDWTLTLIGGGSSTSPLIIVVPDQAIADTILGVTVTGQLFAPVPATATSKPNFLSVTVPASGIGAATAVTVSLRSTTVSPATDIYNVDIVATMTDGSTVTAQRTVSLFVDVSGNDQLGIKKTEDGTPDLQIKSTDVSLSPSIPRPGDTLDIRFKVTNAGDGPATAVPITLQVNGVTVATETYDLKAGASTLGGFQYQLPGKSEREFDRYKPARNASFKKVDDLQPEDAPAEPELKIDTSRGLDVRVVIDPTGSVRQKTALNKAVPLTKAALGQLDGTLAAPTERVYLEMSTLCAGFRPSSGVVGDCEGGSELDIAIEDFANSRFSLTALYGIADLGTVEVSAATAAGAQFNTRAMLVLGHTYAVQLSGNRVGYVRFAASLTPRQLEAEARRRFGALGIRILRKLGGDTGPAQVGDVSGHISADALMYFDMSFRVP